MGGPFSSLRNSIVSEFHPPPPPHPPPPRAKIATHTLVRVFREIVRLTTAGIDARRL